MFYNQVLIKDAFKAKKKCQTTCSWMFMSYISVQNATHAFGVNSVKKIRSCNFRLAHFFFYIAVKTCDFYDKVFIFIFFIEWYK